VRILLEGGYRVRATVRSADKGEYIAGLLGARYPGKFEYVLVEDMEREGAFDAAAAGVAGVLHTASPFHFDSEGRALDALINPAVNGTKNVLRSVLKADTVQRVVVTSSFASIGALLLCAEGAGADPRAADFTATPSGRAITETEWNEFSGMCTRVCIRCRVC
jgi:nucleoside-diphosphate-sugar epimerase